MFSISRDFAPPLRMIEPFFKIGSVFYALGILFLLFLSPTSGHVDLITVGWVHWFSLGFVMMIIFGAMAQLIPVVLETGHVVVDVYYIILPLLGIGASVMVLGFWMMPALLPYGGLLVLIAMVIFASENVEGLRVIAKEWLGRV